VGNKPRVAIVHDWLTGMRGGEKCLEVFCELFPDATLFTLFHKKGSASPVIEAMDIRTSFLDRIPGAIKYYRNFLPLFPRAIESFDLSGYDLVLSSSHCVAKGVRVPEGSLHICFCYTPMRYAWKFFDEYFSGENPLKRKLISLVVERLKRWDINNNKKVDYFIAISDNVRNRIMEYYGREADVIYPPVEVDVPAEKGRDGGYYLVVSALVPYKKIDLAVNAFTKSGKRLIVVGTGPESAALKQAAGENIDFYGWATDDELEGYYASCRALVFPGDEDFGIVPVEAQAYGKPVIAYSRGGVLETVVPLGREGATGVFFREQTPEALGEAVLRFEENIDSFDPGAIKENASRFNRDRFKREIREYIDSKIGGR